MSKPPEHPATDTLLRFLDGELPVRESARVRGHLEACWACRTQVNDLSAVIGDFMHYRETVLKPWLPAPPRPWDNLQELVKRAGPAAAAPMQNRLRVWLVAAAAMLALCVVVWRLEQVPAVSADDLLQRAIRSESPSFAPQLIRISTRSRTFLRPARASGADSLQPLFAGAHYSWDNPLSAESFATWRHRLRDKQDLVSAEQGAWCIRTTTSDGDLSAATLTLRKADLQPVSERLQFRNQEWVEMTEVSEPGPTALTETPGRAQPAPGEMALPAPPPAPTAQNSPVNPISRELQVLVALHGIGADLGEPIDIAALDDGRVLLTATGLAPERQREVASALAALPWVAERFEDAASVQPRAARSAGSAFSITTRPLPLQPRMEQFLGGRGQLESFSDRVLDASEAAMARVYALRRLADRFPPGLAPADHALLLRIRSDHEIALARKLDEVRLSMLPLLESLGAGPNTLQPPLSPEETAARADRLLNALLAGADIDLAPDQLVTQLAAVLRPAGGLP